MLSPDLELAHLDARQWTAWWHLLVPPRVRTKPSWALVILDGTGAAPGAPLKAIVTGRGSIPLSEVAWQGRDEASLAALGKRLGVAATIVVTRDLIAELAGEIERGLSMSHDLVEQGLVALRALKRHANAGIWSDPPLLDLLPAPSYEPLQKTFDLLIPDRTALAAYVIADDRSRIYSSIIARKESGDIVRAGTHRAIVDLVPEASFARDWTQQHRRVTSAIEERYGKPSLAIFVERATLMRIVTGPSDQLAREINAKRVVIDPAPAWLLGLLGTATVAAMAGRAASALASMLPQSARDRGKALASRAKDALKDSGAHPFALLGFDPIELWARLKHYYRE